MAIPTFVGESGRTSGISSLSVPWATGHTTGDLGILWVETANQAVPSTPAGWQQIAASPVGLGTAGAAGSVRLTLFFKLATSGTEPNVTIGDSGDHQVAGMAVWRGVDQTTPIHTSTGGANASSTSVTAGGLTTTIPDCAIAVFVANAIDISSSATYSGWANASLASPAIAEAFDWNALQGVGGGVGMAWGGKASAGVVGSTTATLTSASQQAWITVAIAAPAVSNPVNLTPGLGQLTLTGFAATIGLSATVRPGLGQLVLTGFAGAITSGPTVKPGTADLVLLGFAPTISAPLTVKPGVGSLVLTGFLPNIAAAGKTIVTGTGSLLFTGFRPTITAPVTVRPGLGQLVLDGIAPTVFTSTLGVGWVEFDVIVATATGVTLNFRWAQFASNAQPLTVKAGSYLEYAKIT